MSQQPIVLTGLHIAVHSPTESRLEIQIEGLTPEKFAQLAVELEDYMEIVDDEYKNQETRGRGWKGRGKRITSTHRTRVLRFSPYPSSFSNTLRAMRRKLYIKLNEKCHVLTGTSAGYYKQNVYILPYINAPEFMAYLQELDDTVEKLNKDMQLFQNTDNWTIIKNILKKYDRSQLLNQSWNIPHISFDVTPLSLNPQAVLEMVESQRGNIAEDLKEEERRGLEKLQHNLQKQYRETVVKAINALDKKLEDILNKIITDKKVDPDEARKSLEQLHKEAESIGLGSLAESVISPLLVGIEDPDKAFEMFGTDKIFSEKVNVSIKGRIKGFIESL